MGKATFASITFASIIIVIIFLFSVGAASAQLADSPWPVFHGNLQHSGLSPYDTSHIEGTVKWAFEAGGSIESSPTIGGDGTIYVGSHDGYLYAVNKDGSEKWKIKIGTPKKIEEYNQYKSILSSPTVGRDETIYVASQDHYLFAISPQGEEKWKFPINVSFDSWASPVIGEDGTIYIISSLPKAGLYAINSDGTEKWHFSINSNAFNSPAIGEDGVIYVGVPTGAKTNKVIAFNPDGTKEWEITTSLFLESSLAIANDGTIYIGSFTDGEVGAGMYAISSNGKEKWHFTIQEKEVWATPAIGEDGTIYVGSIDGNFFAINPDGTEKWSFINGKEVGSSAAIGEDGTIYFGSSDGNFYALNPDGTEKWRYSTQSSVSSSPAIDGHGTIYVAANNGKLYAFDESQEGLLIVFNEDVTKEQAIDLLNSHSLEFLSSPELWKSKVIKAYPSKDEEQMFIETLGNDAKVSYVEPIVKTAEETTTTTTTTTTLEVTMPTTEETTTTVKAKPSAEGIPIIYVVGAVAIVAGIIVIVMKKRI